MRCTRCDFESPAGMNFCGGCGAPLHRTCRACGETSPPGFRFCGSCGEAITPSDTPAGQADMASAVESESVARPRAAAAGPVDDAERRQLTVMFCDLVDSTMLSQQVDAEDLRELVLRYQEAVAQVVATYGGHVAQYLGDGILVYFGYPAAFEDAPRRAALASIDILAAMQLLDASEAVSLRVRIGLHTGSVVAGSMGVSGRSERLAMGETPNVAARIQAMAAPGEALMSERTRMLAGDAVVAESIGPVHLRGIEDAVVLHRLLGARGSLAPRQAPGERRAQVPFVGRDRELATLRRCCQQAESGEGQVVLIDGEPGMGKTRLLQTLREWAEDRDVTWIDVRCSALHTSTPLHPFVELFTAQLAALELGDDTDAISTEGADEGDTPRRRIEQLLRDASIDDPAAPALLAGLLGLPYVARTSGNDISAYSPERIRNRTLRLLSDLLLHPRAGGATVLIVEDLHWADPSTLELLWRTVDHIARQRVLALFTHRPSFRENWESPQHLTRIGLRRLNEADVGALIDEWAPGMLPPAVRAAVVARTDGVPLFVEEVTRALIAAPDHAQDTTHDPAAIAARIDAIPSTLRDILSARLDALGSARETAQLAAVLGRQFRFAEITAISTLPEATLAEHLHHLTHAQILTAAGVPPQTMYTFRHALVQEAAYDSLLRRRRQALHSRAADALSAATTAAAPERLARHLEGAGRWPQATEAYAAAAERASATWAYGEACELARHALAALAKVPASGERDQREYALLAMAVPALVAHHGYTYEEVQRAYARMTELAASLGPPFAGPMLTLNRWGFHCVRGDRQEALQLAAEIQQLADAIGDPSFSALAGFATGASAYYTGDRSAAAEALGRAVAFFEGMEGSRGALDAMGGVLFLACLVHAMVLCDTGQIDDGMTSIARSVALAEEHGSPFHVLQALDYQIWAWLHVGVDLEEIARVAERAEYLRTEFDIGWEHAAIHVGSARIERGDHAAIDVMRATVEATRAKGESNRLALQQVLLARAYITVGRLEEARACIAENLANCERTIAGFPASELHRLQALIAWKQGDLAAAEAHVQRAIEVATLHSAPMFELHAALLGAQILHAQSRELQAKRLLTPAIARVQGGEQTPVVRAALALHAQLHGEALVP